MALTRFQRDVIRLISASRRQSETGYLAGGATLNALLGAPRVSEDVMVFDEMLPQRRNICPPGPRRRTFRRSTGFPTPWPPGRVLRSLFINSHDVFHDTAEAVHVTFESDRAALNAAGLAVSVRREWPTFVEAAVESGEEATRLQWALDSAFRFFPLVDSPELGLSLHPFDLATNKVLALVGRAEPRDWVDVIECDARLQPLGYLAWAAAGKDPGLNPAFILEQAARSGRYTEAELEPLAFDGDRPSAAALSVRWKDILAAARELVGLLPAREAGTCVCGPSGALLRVGPDALREALTAGSVVFRPGSLRGAFPRLA